MNRLLAVTEIPLGSNQINGVGPLGQVYVNAYGGLDRWGAYISLAIGIMTVIAGLWFLFTFIIGIVDILRSGEDKQALEGARKKILNGLIGIIVVVSATFIIGVLGTILGINFLDPVLYLISNKYR